MKLPKLQKGQLYLIYLYICIICIYIYLYICISCSYWKLTGSLIKNLLRLIFLVSQIVSNTGSSWIIPLGLYRPTGGHPMSDSWLTNWCESPTWAQKNQPAKAQLRSVESPSQPLIHSPWKIPFVGWEEGQSGETYCRALCCQSRLTSHRDDQALYPFWGEAGVSTQHYLRSSLPQQWGLLWPSTQS